MDFNGLTEEQKEKIRSATDANELIDLIQSEGIELDDEQLASISGGALWNKSSGGGGLGVKCVQCGSSDVRVEYWQEGLDQCVLRCYSCHYGWLGPVPD